MPAIPPAIETALAFHQAGRLGEAEQIYREVLKTRPNDAGVLHLLGLIAVQRGDHERGIRIITQAILLDGGQAAFHANLGEAFRGLGRWADAEASYRQALRLEPSMLAALNNLGTILQARGDRDGAIALYRQAIAGDPNYADAHNNLGMAYQELGQWREAAECFRTTTQVAPDYHRAHYNLGVLLAEHGQLESAAAAMQRARQIAPSSPETQYGLALVLRRQERLAEAEAAFRGCLELDPAYAEAWVSLGEIYQWQGKTAPAIRHYEQAARVRPGHADAYYNWGTTLEAAQPEQAVEKYRQAIRLRPSFAEAHYNLGRVLQQLERYDEAVVAYGQAIALKGDYVLAHNNLGNVYRAQGRTPEAIACYQRAISLEPQQVQALNNLGSALQDSGQLDDSIDCFRQASAADSQCAEAYINLGAALQEQGDWSTALECYDTGLRLRPDFAEGRFNRALLNLTHERFAEGWADYGWRLKTKRKFCRDVPAPLWDGSPLEGRTLLVHAEQGLGDTLQFVRYLKEARRYGGRLVFEAQQALVPLLLQSGFGETVAAAEEPQPCDVHTPLMNLPAIFQTNLKNLPSDVPYLVADDERIESWRERLSAFKGVRVGLNWQGNKAYSMDRYRSFPLAAIEPLAIEGVHLFSLQKGAGGEQIGELNGRFEVNDLAAELDRDGGAFLDTAAAMKSLDVVISCDSAAVHLAGGLGVKVWLATPKIGEWRWFLHRTDSPWYPTMRVFRQQTQGRWAEVFLQMAEHLKRLVALRAES